MAEAGAPRGETIIRYARLFSVQLAVIFVTVNAIHYVFVAP
jgi:hypothetical protein